MADSDANVPPDAGEIDEALLRAISHPLRQRLLGMLDGRTASPNELARELELPLGRVSYHIRLLHDLGAIELLRTEPRRGALEHFYRAVTRIRFSEADWARLPRSIRQGIVGQTLQQVFADVTTAADAGGFDRAGAELRRASFALDDEGLSDMSSLVRESMDRAHEISARSAARQSEAATPQELVSTELAILHFARRS
jgi:DNA-binding transcriptional ArsR family regulator